ncbi:hypothetical protein BBW65_03225 [Helicobacter enhydrae]|uniref:Molecular chaperone TorD family protein n=1 Tax=Helicobacter enhydrae TaxID=222136 RepID=A0A1B1U4Z8_9HELI|nr:molecular chaperone TorD family protein [Helicobacter enhydrae]ANV97874.1 hypothetical protein BBW65_03225 [Helicobacter enhydrae]
MKEEEIQINKARGMYYALLGMFFSYQSLSRHRQTAIAILEQIFANAINDQTQKDAQVLLNELEANGTARIEQEFDALFVDNFTYKCINLTASYYDEGWEFGEKCLKIRDLVLESEFRRNEEFVEPEDHLGFLLMFCSSLLEKANPCAIAMCQKIFAEILNDYVNFVVLETLKSKKAHFYKSVVKILGSFAEFERLYLDVTPPPLEEFVDLQDLKAQEKKAKWKKRVKADMDEDTLKQK